MYSAVQTAAVTIINYKPLSGLNFTRYTHIRQIYTSLWGLYNAGPSKLHQQCREHYSTHASSLSITPYLKDKLGLYKFTYVAT